MSEVGKIRYWKREEVDPKTKTVGMIYFATASNAAHARAEDDTKATEVGFEEYSSNVPKGVHNGEDRTPEPIKPTDPVDPAAAKAQAFMELQEWSQRNSGSCTIQDQISMLALWQHSLCNWALAAMQQGHRGGDNVQ